MIDVHLIVMEGQDEQWKSDAIRSIPSEFPLYLTPAVEGHAGKARYAGYMLGENKYKLFLDADDWFEVDGLYTCANYLERNPQPGVVFLEQVWDYFKQTVYIRGNHRAILHIDTIKDFESLYKSHPGCADQQVINQLDDLTRIGVVGYNWRKYNSGCYKLRRAAGYDYTKPNDSAKDLLQDIHSFKRL